jgi:pimeloyl-ACP methyl ester carboxylesterase
MYDPRNGFTEPPAWSEYSDAFVARYREGQRERVARLDRMARELLERSAAASAAANASDFADKPADEKRAIMRQRVNDPVMTIYRTNANPTYVDKRIDPSGRDYGSLLSERPDLMNYAALGLARTCTPRAWLSTWSGLSSNADLVANLARITTPTLVVQAGRDREIYPSDVKAMDAAIASPDKRVVTIDHARHYFEPELGEKTAPHVEELMDIVVPWIAEKCA